MVSGAVQLPALVVQSVAPRVSAACRWCACSGAVTCWKYICPAVIWWPGERLASCFRRFILLVLLKLATLSSIRFELLPEKISDSGAWWRGPGIMSWTIISRYVFHTIATRLRVETVGITATESPGQLQPFNVNSDVGRCALIEAEEAPRNWVLPSTLRCPQRGSRGATR